jgi:hypothetical protein
MGEYHWAERNLLTKADRIGQGYTMRTTTTGLDPDMQRRGNTSAREFLPRLIAGFLPMQKTSGFRIGWTLCWKWRNCVGLGDKLQVGFLHRSKGNRAACYCVSMTPDVGWSVSSAITCHGLSIAADQRLCA